LIISIIVAKATNNAIGLKGDLPWRLPADLKHFKKTTAGHHVIMGRKTFETLNKPLPGRTHLVITSNHNYKVPEGHEVVHSLEEAIAIGKEKGLEKIFILGGAEIYKLALPYSQEMIITEIEAFPEADTYFPDFDKENWVIFDKSIHHKDENNPFDFAFVTYRRKAVP
tara:strand:+ start:12267 stop:12770 length:504 start_codon:yes stop_codon:yes gene_type:complete